MTVGDPYLVVRAASIYLAAVLTFAAWTWRRPPARARAGAALASLWNLPIILLLHLIAARAGWWAFDARGGLLLGMPVDLYLAWACLWGAVPALAFPSVPLTAAALVVFAADVLLMPLAWPVLRLGPGWLAGESIGLLFGFVPGQLLARWTARDEHLAGRTILQVVMFSGLMLVLLPAIVIEGTGGISQNPFLRPAWQISLIAQVLAVPALIGLTAVQEFVTRGGGTPIPFDPPRRLVTTGIYAYVRNPMQLSAVLLLLLLGLLLRNWWLAAAGVMAHVYSLGLAGWDEGDDLRRRFGDEWDAYRRGVPLWIPRIHPWCHPRHAPARLYVAYGCGMCREVGRWFEARGTRSLLVLPAESHPSRSLRRITYEPPEGPAAGGVHAVGRALEHVHLGWALAGCVMRLPVVSQAAQLLVDASGGEPRDVPRCRGACSASAISDIGRNTLPDVTRRDRNRDPANRSSERGN